MFYFVAGPEITEVMIGCIAEAVLGNLKEIKEILANAALDFGKDPHSQNICSNLAHP